MRKPGMALSPIGRLLLRLTRRACYEKIAIRLGLKVYLNDTVRAFCSQVLIQWGLSIRDGRHLPINLNFSPASYARMRFTSKWSIATTIAVSRRLCSGYFIIRIDCRLKFVEALYRLPVSGILTYVCMTLCDSTVAGLLLPYRALVILALRQVRSPGFH